MVNSANLPPKKPQIKHGFGIAATPVTKNPASTSYAPNLQMQMVTLFKKILRILKNNLIAS